MQEQTTSVVDQSSQVAQTIVHDERRTFPRSPKPLVTQVKQLGDMNIHDCAVRDISENGLYMRIPSDCHLSVGHRCEVSIVGEGEVGSCGGLIGESLYATVVRSERIELETETVVGVGLRFDQPLYF